MESIQHAGIKTIIGVLKGKSHADIREALPKVTEDTTREDQGFVTSTGRFVNRIIATEIAYGSGQLSDEHYELIGGGELISENLWEYGGYEYSKERGYYKDE